MGNDTQSGDEGAKAFVILVMFAIGAYLTLHIIALTGVLVCVVLIGLSVYFGYKFGYKVAMDSEVWENRRIAKHQKYAARLEAEKGYFLSQGNKMMVNRAEAHYENKSMELYKEQNRFEETLNKVKQIKDVFRKQGGQK